MVVEQPTARRARAHIVYRLADGTPVPGVTQVLSVLAKPGLVPWANQLGLQGIDTRKYVDGLARIGTLAHHLIERHWSGEEPDTDGYSAEEIDRAETCYLKFLDWQKGHTINVLFAERPLVSEQHRFGGTVDALAEVDGVLTVIDIKTAKAIYEEHLYQVAAYRQLVREAGHEPQAIRILQVGRSDEEGFSERTVSGPEIDRYWEIFRHALAIWRLKEEIRNAG